MYNFAAGPACLPEPVLALAREELFARGEDGAGLLERPFGHPETRRMIDEARERLAALLALPANYHILFLAGGAMQQFAAVPLNLLGPGQTAAYADSGYWARRAIAEARRFGQVAVVARAPDTPPLVAPSFEDWRLPPDCAYCHITPNETADGIAYAELPDTGAVPLVADATSCFLAAPVDVSRFGLIYASAQKNIGPAGMTVVIVREDLLEREASHAPSTWRYRLQAEQGSRVNTPPLVAIHLAGLVFEWIAVSGGLTFMAEMNRRKGQRLYAAIDGSGGFYRAPVASASRSLTNVRFHLHDAALTEPFLAAAEAAGLFHLRGHPQLGGLRASLYNAMPEAGAAALADFLGEFARRHG
ncbi:MAG: phosphoserine aminotransferase [Betaproteobacteria bacterium]|nr:MAG: phosphoserine aminotransferase [Betaproteobacteria bacterium]